MCFSATASFAAGTALSVVGVSTLKKTKTNKEIPFATIPLLFGVQQIIEGGVWLSFKYGMPFLNQIATYSFVFIAYVLWPIVIPFSVGLLEPDVHRKKILNLFQLIGSATGLYLLYFILVHPISSSVVNESIKYTAPSKYGIYLVLAYVLATCISCLFSSHRIINILGILATLSLMAAYHFYTVTYTSVWCFFAALLSAVVYWYFRKSK